MTRREVRVLGILTILLCVGCGRIGVELLSVGELAEDSGLAGPDQGDGGALDASRDGAPACPTPCENIHGSASCSTGVCLLECAVGYTDCDGDPSNGCETNVVSDPANCGACDVPCQPSDQTCIEGTCQLSTCPPGRADCDSDSSDCETDLTSTISNCGFCGNSCTIPNGSPACVSGACTIASCDTDFGDCDGDARNGCETSLSTAENCGTCGHVCPDDMEGASPACNAGACTSVCDDLSGVYAAKINVRMTWSETPFVRSGSGTFEYWVRMVLTQSGTTLTGSFAVCGRTLPDGENAIFPERYGLSFLDSAFDGAMPETPFNATLGDTGPSASFSLQRTALMMGATLGDPVNSPWPSLSQILPMATDHDGDGRPGVTARFRNDGSYAYAPTSSSLFAPRASHVYISDRLLFSLSGSLTSCGGSSGTANVERLESHRVGCQLESGSQCSSSQYTHIDENIPDYRPSSADYVFTRVGGPGAVVTCAAVRTAAP